MKQILVCIALLTVGSVLSAQDLPEFNMSDTTITECDGILYDSGGDGGIYTINEDLTFTITTDAPISIQFVTEFCVETNLDFLYIYDGPDTGSPLIAELTGTNIGLPGPFVATSGSITFNFISDQSVAYCGWTILWSTNAPPPIPPDLEVNTMPVCESSFIQVDFNPAIGCDWLIEPDDFEVIGPVIMEVLDVDIVCDGDSADYLLLEVDPPVWYNCQYLILAELGIPDVCDSIWNFTLNTTFDYEDCPMRYEIGSSADTICSGNCSEIWAATEGCYNYSFIWDNDLPATQGPHEVCPDTTTTYTVTITEVESGTTVTDSLTITVIESNILLNDTTLCQSSPPIDLEGGIEGTWEGPGILDMETGWFEPDSANAGLNVIYFITEYCTDSLYITISPIDAGNIIAACPGSPAFQMEATPPGGVWDGPFTTPDGMFDPMTVGSYEVTYEVNGCSDTLLVNVDDIAGTFTLETLCQSNFPDTIDFSPLGGYWVGEGIIDSLLGAYDPREMSAGIHELQYFVEGCDQIFTIEILEINTGNKNQNSCPEEDSFIPFPNFSPIGGTWEGWGITDPLTGMYDPSIVSNNTWTDLIYYAPNGCTDTIHMYNMQTSIYTDTIFFCAGADNLPLDWDNVGRTPWGGQWTGTGVVNPEGNYFEFSPVLAGVGEHLLTYTNNTCSDTMLAIVYPNELTTESLIFCSDAEELIVQEGLSSGGVWWGNGITDNFEGIFDPGNSAFGESYVYWYAPPGCFDSVYVFVEEFFQAEIFGLDDVYCYQDVDLEVGLFPGPGLLTGATTDSTFNPAQANQGLNTLIYQYSGDLCFSSDTMEIWVFPEIETSLFAEENPICGGTGTTLWVEAEGGFPDSLLTYSWSDDLFPISSNTVSPSETTTYYVTIDDGCSDPSIDSIVVEILPPISADVITSDTACFGDDGWAEAMALPSGDYSYTWGSNPAIPGNSVEGTAGTSFVLEITDNTYGCVFDSLVLIPNYSPVGSNFSVNPNAECIPFEENPLNFIDLSQYALSGTWDFGNGSTQNYEPGENPYVDYNQAGQYLVSLIVTNEGDCQDTSYLDLCILPPTPIFIPDIFSPNDDGWNDILFVRGEGIVSMQFVIYSRWGEEVFSSDNVDNGWNGYFRGQPMPSGVYVYYLKALLNTGDTQEMKGNITLLR